MPRPTLHLVLASRQELPFPTNRLVIDGLATEIDTADLAFTTDEIQLLLGDDSKGGFGARPRSSHGAPAAGRSPPRSPPARWSRGACVRAGRRRPRQRAPAPRLLRRRGDGGGARRRRRVAPGRRRRCRGSRPSSSTTSASVRPAGGWPTATAPTSRWCPSPTPRAPFRSPRSSESSCAGSRRRRTTRPASTSAC